MFFSIKDFILANSTDLGFMVIIFYYGTDNSVLSRCGSKFIQTAAILEW